MGILNQNKDGANGGDQKPFASQLRNSYKGGASNNSKERKKQNEKSFNRKGENSILIKNGNSIIEEEDEDGLGGGNRESSVNRSSIQPKSNNKLDTSMQKSQSMQDKNDSKQKQ